jgi:hypothetical protein
MQFNLLKREHLYNSDGRSSTMCWKDDAGPTLDSTRMHACDLRFMLVYVVSYVFAYSAHVG